MEDAMIVLDPTQQPLADDTAASALSPAPRLDSFEGKTIGLWCNRKLNAARFLDMVREELARDFAFDVVHGVYDPGRLMNDEEWGEADRCDAIILANGDCGACSTSGIANAIEFEKKGIPAILLSTTPFVQAVTTTARLAGMPTIEWVVVDHPIGSLPEDVLRERAREAVRQLPGLLLARAAPESRAPESRAA
jgi:hypothetical protein